VLNTIPTESAATKRNRAKLFIRQPIPDLPKLP